MKKIVLWFIMLAQLNSHIALGVNQDLGETPSKRAEESAKYYEKHSADLLKYQGRTVQQTYKAYDWYEDKMEQKALKQARRHEEIMQAAKYGTSYYPYSYYNPYSYYYSYPSWYAAPYTYLDLLFDATLATMIGVQLFR